MLKADKQDSAPVRIAPVLTRFPKEEWEGMESGAKGEDLELDGLHHPRGRIIKMKKGTTVRKAEPPKAEEGPGGHQEGGTCHARVLGEWRL